jgi:superfamily II DNA or RNA helicase
MTNKEKTRIQNEIVNSVEELHGRLLLAPRVGKSRIAIQLIKKFKPQSILWVSPSANLVKKEIPEEFITWGAKKYLKRLTTVTYSSLPKIKEKFDLIILDEEQHLTELNSQKLIQNGNYDSILSMTGTPTKHKNKLNLYKALNLGTLYEMKINTAVDLGILANYEVTVLKIPYNREKMKKYSQVQAAIESKTVATFEYHETHLTLKGQLEGGLGLSEREPKHGGRLFAIIGKDERTMGYFVVKEDGTYTGKVVIEGTEYRFTDDKVHLPYHKSMLIARKRYIGDSQLKTDVAKTLLQRLEGERKIIFCNSIEQAEILSPECTFHSKTTRTNLDGFLDGFEDTIAMVNMGGTGFTFKRLDHLIIVQCDSDRNGSTSQKICRTLLSQKQYAAKVWVLCIEGTQDEVWTKLTLESFDPSKITYKTFE